MYVLYAVDYRNGTYIPVHTVWSSLNQWYTEHKDSKNLINHVRYNKSYWKITIPVARTHGTLSYRCRNRAGQEGSMAPLKFNLGPTQLIFFIASCTCSILVQCVVSWWQSRWRCSTSALWRYREVGREDLCCLSFAKVLKVHIYALKNVCARGHITNNTMAPPIRVCFLRLCLWYQNVRYTVLNLRLGSRVGLKEWLCA